ncbi:hypothetical protein ANO11243_056450 [Dothideomycetidae sp. 11243]|nr:hypothetical protein ANO11243_056450 [fungal sp. No.11243]
MIRHCIDCDRWQINLVVLTEDKEQFTKAIWHDQIPKTGNDSIGYWLPGLRLMEYEKMHFEYYEEDVEVAETTKKMHRFMLQGMKKMHGCLDSGRRHCFLLDSEGIVVRTTYLSDIVKDYLDEPFIIHSPENRNGTVVPVIWSTPCGEMLDIPNFETIGWMLEYYLWIFDSRLYGEIARIFAGAYPIVKGAPEQMFLDICYYAYIWAEKGPYEGPKYRFIEVKEILGDRLFNLMWPRRIYEKGADTKARLDPLRDGRAMIEDMRDWLRWFPNMLVPAAEAWNRQKLALWKVGDYWQTLAFFSIAKSIRLCVSEQNRDVVEAAMVGAMNLDDW